MKYYSICKGGFYDNEIHERMPSDAIEISDEKYRELLNALSNGKVVVISDGELTAVNPPPPTVIELGFDARYQRDNILKSQQWIIERHRDELEHLIATTLTAEQYTELQTYRQQLRDWPAQPGWPDIEMPAPPDWLALLLK